MLPEYSLEGRRVVVTGAGRGIGKGIALVMAEAGARLAITALTPVGIGEVASAIAKGGGECHPIAADATKQEEMGRAAREALQKLGGVDVLINCVGDAIPAPVVPLPGDGRPAMDQAYWQRVIDINLTQAFLGCREFGPTLLAQRRGSVINIASFAAVRARGGRSAYDAGKAGLVQFTASLALEWAPFKVRANAISPGQFPDPAQQTPEQARQSEEAAAKNVPLGRPGRLREVGLLAVYLASDASAYVTGQNFVIDGGITVA